jgi:hypothetical protein
MAIDPKNLDPLRRLAAKVTPLTDEETVTARVGLQALLSEREWLTASLADLRTETRDAYRHLDPSGLSDVPLTMLAEAVRRTHDAALSLLREVEWAGRLSDGKTPCCPSCRGPMEGLDGRPLHTPDCRLAAVLRGSR